METPSFRQLALTRRPKSQEPRAANVAPVATWSFHARLSSARTVFQDELAASVCSTAAAGPSETYHRQQALEHVLQDALRHRVPDRLAELRTRQVSGLDHLGVHPLQPHHLIVLHVPAMARQPEPTLGGPGCRQARADVDHDMAPGGCDVDGGARAVWSPAHVDQLRPRCEHILLLVGPAQDVLNLVLGPRVQEVLEGHWLARSRPRELTELCLQPDDVDPRAVLVGLEKLGAMPPCTSKRPGNKSEFPGAFQQYSTLSSP